MAVHRRPHPFIPTVLGALTGVPVHEVAANAGASGQGAYGAAVVAAGLVGLLLGSIARKGAE